MTGATLDLLRGFARQGPLYAMVQLTAGCNLRCRFCRVHTLASQDPSELSLSELGRLAQAIRKTGVRVTTLAGEPLLRSDLVEIVGVFSNAGLSVRLGTNGVLLHEGLLSDLLSAGLSGLSLSLHSLDPAVTDALSGTPGTHDRVMAAIHGIERLTARWPGFLRVLNMVLCKANLGEVEDLLNFSESHGFFLSLIPLHTSPQRTREPQFARRAPDLLPDPTEIAILRQRAARWATMRKRGRGFLNSSRFLTLLPSIFEGRPDWPCLAGTLYYFVDHRGRVSPCHELDPLGDLVDPVLLDSARRGNLGGRARILRKTCSGCLLPCWTELSLMVSHPRSLAEALALNLGLRAPGLRAPGLRTPWPGPSNGDRP